MPRPFPFLRVLAALLIAACEAPGDAAYEPSAAARDAPPPQLAETARFTAPLATATPDAERLAEGTDALAARAAALRGRADALGAPVIGPAEQRRLTDAVRAGET
jgi:hypothetical protein